MPSAPAANSGTSCWPARPKTCIASAALRLGSSTSAMRSAIRLNCSSGDMPCRSLRLNPRSSNVSTEVDSPRSRLRMLACIRLTPFSTTSKDDPDCSAANPSCDSGPAAIPVRMDILSIASPAFVNSAVIAMRGADAALARANTPPPTPAMPRPKLCIRVLMLSSPWRSLLSRKNSSTNAEPALMDRADAMLLVVLLDLALLVWRQ